MKDMIEDKQESKKKSLKSDTLFWVFYIFNFTTSNFAMLMMSIFCDFNKMLVVAIFVSLMFVALSFTAKAFLKKLNYETVSSKTKSIFAYAVSFLTIVIVYSLVGTMLNVQAFYLLPFSVCCCLIMLLCYIIKVNQQKPTKSNEN